MPRADFNCKACGETFSEYPSKGREFCSRKCFHVYRAEHNIPMKPRTGRTEPCLQCAVDVWRTVSEQRKGSHRYCSKACADTGKITERVDRACPYCGTVVTRAINDPKRYCSKRCDELRRIKKPLERTHNGLPARLDGDGYVWVWEPEHHNSAKYNGWIQEHRLVAERAVGQRLGPDVDVHHINRIKHDNRPENLEVVDPVTHTRYTANERLTDRRLLDEYIKRFGPIDGLESAPWLLASETPSR